MLSFHFDRNCQITQTIVSGVITLCAALMVPTPTVAQQTGKTSELPITKLITQYWPMPARVADYPERKVKYIKDRASFGVALHGGGNRAAPAALGQLRMLHDLGWIEKVGYISAISGGAWTAIPYTYLPKNLPQSAGKEGCSRQTSVPYDDPTQCRFFGKFIPPETIGRHLLKPDASGEFEAGSMLGAINDSWITSRFLAEVGRGRFDEIYAGAVGRIFLAPFGLSRGKANGSERIFTWRASDRDRLIRMNEDRLKKTHFNVVERRRPFLIVGGTLLTKRRGSGPENKLRIEMTPLYSGIPGAVLSKSSGRRVTGGGFAESAGYDMAPVAYDRTKDPDTMVFCRPKWGARVDPNRLRFSLADMMSISSAAPQETILGSVLFSLPLSNLGFPEHYTPSDNLVPVTIKEGRIDCETKPPKAKEWAHGDGGHEDNLGIMPHLQRRVGNILSFVNTVKPLNETKYDECGELLENPASLLASAHKKMRKKLEPCEKMIGDDVASLFIETGNHIHNVSLEMMNHTRKGDRAHKRLRGYYDLFDVATAFKSEDSLSCQQYRHFYPKETLDRAYTGYKPRICFLWLSHDQGWFDAIKSDVERTDWTNYEKKKVRKVLDLNKDWKPAGFFGRSVGISKGFPHIGTLLDRAPGVIKISKARSLALTNFTSWALESRSKVIAHHFAKGGLKLPH